MEYSAAGVFARARAEKYDGTNEIIKELVATSL